MVVLKTCMNISGQFTSRLELVNVTNLTRGFLQFLSLFSSMQVSIEDIEAAEMAYRGSEEETKDLKDLYLRFKGDMNKLVFLFIILSYFISLKNSWTNH